MERRDFMLGDLVYHKFYTDPERKDVFHVDVDVLRDIEEGNFKVSYEPIPLTKKILELNGFLDNTYMRLELDENTSIAVCICSTIPIPVYVDTELWHYCFPPITYVHELQHILRKLKFDDLAYNLKIEE